VHPKFNSVGCDLFFGLQQNVSYISAPEYSVLNYQFYGRRYMSRQPHPLLRNVSCAKLSSLTDLSDLKFTCLVIYQLY